MIKTLFPFLVVALFVPISNAYWIVAQVKEISWQQNCIQDRQCDAMELSLVLDSNSDETGSAQTSWKLDNVLKNPESSKMFVHWTEAQLTNITLKTLLTSNDVLFNIPRPCDHSSALHIFSPTIKASAYNSQQLSEDVEVDKRQTIGLVGKCFHVIIEVKLYAKICPWCYPPTTTKSVSNGDAFSISFNQILESPAIVAFVLFILFVVIIVIILCAFNVQKRRKLQNYQQQYTSSSLSEMGFNRGGHMQSIVGNIPMPPMLRPPLIPDETIKCYQLNGNTHEPSICPYYETLDTHTLQKAPISRPTKETTENYDSAFDQSIGGSPNSSFSGQNLSDSGRCSPQLAQQMPHQIVRPRAEYV
ncbi:hypothetical protein M3Y97_00070000 [Aphelenchoides bicaudatus]|nr:hypothetical protein M3Y97_00070000 [Aphelenchoides bicaudatus]